MCLIVAGNNKRDPLQAICIYLVINTQLVSPSSQALKKISTVYPYLFPCHPLDSSFKVCAQLNFPYWDIALAIVRFIWLRITVSSVYKELLYNPNWPVLLFPSFSSSLKRTYIEIMGWFSSDSDQAQAYDQVGCLHLPTIQSYS